MAFDLREYLGISLAAWGAPIAVQAPPSRKDQHRGALHMDSFAAKGLTGAVGLALALTASGAAAQEVNLYSSRHYDTDVALYDAFTEQSGIAVNLIEGDADQLIERIKAEGRNSPADVLITVDAGRLWRADEAGLLQPVSSAGLEKRIPANPPHPGGQRVRASKRVG